MQNANHPLLVVPGWGGSGPAHWQTLWQHELEAPGVELADWLDPTCEVWLDALDRAVHRLQHPPLLVAHSLGCIVVARWVREMRRPIRAALLVAPADVDRISTLRDFGPVPDEPLPFPSLVVTSDDDPYVSTVRAETFARWWGSELHVIPAGGHLNADSGLGNWLAGRRLLRSLAS
jgi:hypothetical protein